MGPASPLSKPGKQRGAPDRRDRSGLLQATDGELIDPRGLGDILYPALADILEGHVELAVDRVEGWPGYADPAGFGEGFQARGHVDVVAINVRTRDDDVPDVDADPEPDVPVEYNGETVFRSVYD